MDEFQLKRIQEIKKLLDEGISRKEFTESFENALKQIFEIEKKIIERSDKKTERTLKDLEDLKEQFKVLIEECRKASDSTFGSIKRRLIEAIENVFVKNLINEKVNQAIDSVASFVRESQIRLEDAEINVINRLSEIKEVDEEGLTERIVALIPDPLTPEDIRDSLESIEENDEKLSIDAIKDLGKELEELKKKKIVYGGSGGSSGGGRIVKSWDLSASLDGGATRTFATPAMWRPISIHLSSFPNILRETVDYTWTQQSITITSEIPDVSLEAGQTLVLVYSEA